MQHLSTLFYPSIVHTSSSSAKRLEATAIYRRPRLVPAMCISCVAAAFSRVLQSAWSGGNVAVFHREKHGDIMLQLYPTRILAVDKINCTIRVMKSIHLKGWTQVLLGYHREAPLSSSFVFLFVPYTRERSWRMLRYFFRADASIAVYARAWCVMQLEAWNQLRYSRYVYCTAFPYRYASFKRLWCSLYRGAEKMSEAPMLRHRCEITESFILLHRMKQILMVLGSRSSSDMRIECSMVCDYDEHLLLACQTR